jgi:hypothetical protein
MDGKRVSRSLYVGIPLWYLNHKFGKLFSAKEDIGWGVAFLLIELR